MYYLIQKDGVYMAWDFAADSVKQEEIAKKIDDAADKFDGKVKEMYSEIDGMGAHWQGEDYNLYKENTHGYETALKDLSNGMRMFAVHFREIATGTDDLANDLKDTITNLVGEESTASGVTPPATEIDGITTPNNGGGTTPGNGTNNNAADGSTGNPSGELTSGEDFTPGGSANSDSGAGRQLETSQPVTVQSGQKVTLNGEEVYFLMKDRSGNTYYTKSADENAQVFVDDGTGLKEYTSYSNDKIVSRSDFVKDRKYNMDYFWNMTFNDGTSPYDAVGTTVESSFTDGVSNPGQGNIIFDESYLNQRATTLDKLDMGEIGLGRANTPDVIYLAPNQSIKYDKPWDTYDNTIKGGENGSYLVYDSATDAYYKVDNGSYNTQSDGTFGLWISRDQLLDERTTINK